MRLSVASYKVFCYRFFELRNQVKQAINPIKTAFRFHIDAYLKILGAANFRGKRLRDSKSQKLDPVVCR